MSMDIKIIQNPIKRAELIEIAKEGFGDVVKAVIDIEQKILAVGGELHSDEEVVLMEKYNSKRENTWGLNIYPKKPTDEWIEFDSMVNIKPAHGNRSRDIEDQNIQEKIKKIVRKLITD